MLFKIKTYIILYPRTPYFSTLLKIKIHIGKFVNYDGKKHFQKMKPISGQRN